MGEGRADALSPRPPPAREGESVSLSDAAALHDAGRALARLVLALILLAMWQYLPGADLRFWMSGPVEIVARL